MTRRIPTAFFYALLAVAVPHAAWAAAHGQADSHRQGGDHMGEHEHEHEQEHGHQSAHGHVAPHGGTLVLMGDHGTGAHLELVLDSESGEIRGYVLDGEAENPVRIEQSQIELEVALEGRETLNLMLLAQENPLSGETIADTSEFAGMSPLLKGAHRFEGRIRSLRARGIEHRDIKFDYPEGNE